MLKKIVLILILCTVSFPAFSVDTSTLKKLEESVFGIDYSKEKIENRLARLEKNIYGKSKTVSLEMRFSKLSKDMSADVLGKEIPPTSDTFYDDEIAQSDGSENYPIINEIEEKLFRKSSPEKSLHSRIKNIEKHLFSKTYESEDYFNRMERIKAEYYSKNPNQNPETLCSDYPDTFYSEPEKYYSAYNPTDEYELSRLEKKLLKNNYPNDTFNDRLSRLETKVFETDFFYDDPKIRLDRLASATEAKKSFKKYDSNRFYSKLNTGMQIGSMLLMLLAFVL